MLETKNGKISSAGNTAETERLKTNKGLIKGGSGNITKLNLLNIPGDMMAVLFGDLVADLVWHLVTHLPRLVVALLLGHQ